MSDDDRPTWEKKLVVEDRAALLAAWARSEISPSGGLFTTGMGGFRVSGRIEPFLSQVVGRDHEANQVLACLLDHHPREAPWVLTFLSRNAVEAARERQKVGRLDAPGQAKQMTRAMLDYSVSLGVLVQRINRTVIQNLQTNASLPAIVEGIPGDSLTSWLIDCATLATDESPSMASKFAHTELATFLVDSIRSGHLHDALRATPVEPPQARDLADEDQWQLVASGEADQIESELIALAGLSDLWYETNLREHFSFMDDLLECTSAFIETTSDEDQLPGQSWARHEVYVRDVPAVCAELQARAHQLADVLGASTSEKDEDAK